MTGIEEVLRELEEMLSDPSEECEELPIELDFWADCW